MSTVDLVPSILGSSGPTSASPGDTVTLTIQVDNQGNSASGASGYRIYLSPDVDIDLDDIVLIGSSFPAIAGGDYWSLETEATVPASTSSGDYYWGIIVDIHEYVDEEDEGNNAASFGYVTIGESEVPVPQLEVEVLSVAPDAAAFGDSFQVLVRVSNVGGGSTGTIDYEIFLSIDSTLLTPDVKIGEGTVPESLSEGEAWSGTKSATATSFYGEGQFYVIVRMTPWGYEDAGDWDAGDRIYLISGGSGGLGEDDSSESSSGDFLPVASVLGLIILVGVIIIIGSVMRARTGSQSVVLPAFSRDDAETRTSSPRPRRTGSSGPPPPPPGFKSPTPPPTNQEREIAELKAKVSELLAQSNLPEDESPDIEAALRAISDEEKSPDVDDKALAGESESADSQDGNGSVEGVDEASRAKFCSQCGCTVGSDSKFCSQCGNMI